nr:hypothetical protein [Tanacetum cinerariifolium]
MTTTTTTTHPPQPQLQQSTIDFLLIKGIGELEQIMANLIQNNKYLEERLESHEARLYTLENLDIPQQVSKVVDEIVTDAVDWAIQAPLCNRFRDLPKADMKEILHQRMWKTNFYKAQEDHIMLYEALKKSRNLDHTNELLKDLAEAHKKGEKETSLKTAASAIYTAWTTTNTRLWPSVLSILEDLHMDDDMDPDAQPLEEDKPATPEPAWSILSFDMSVLTNNWASALASTYITPPEDSLLAQTGDMAMFVDWLYLEYLRYGSKGSRPALSISKIKAAYYPDVGLEQMVPDQIAIQTLMRILTVVRIEVFSMYGYDYMIKIVLRRADLNEHIIVERDFKYLYLSDIKDLYLLNLQGHLNHLPPIDKKILTTLVKLWTKHLVIRQRVKDFQLGIESYQTQLNLTKPLWDATGFEYKHNFMVIDSLRSITFRDKYGVQMIMRFNEIHKFSDGPLHQMDEALDYRVKEFKVNRMNLGLNTRFWIRKDVDRSKEFMFAIHK